MISETGWLGDEEAERVTNSIFVMKEENLAIRPKAIEQKKPQRVHSIDVFRGLLMLLVILGHSIGDVSDPVNKFILSFHMPAFFILSGMCFNPKRLECGLWATMKRKGKGLVWPYITLSLIGVTLYWLMLAGTTKSQGVGLSQTLIGILWNDGRMGKLVTPGFWFVYDLIWINAIYLFTKSINRFIRLAVAVMLFVALYYGDVHFYFSLEVIRKIAGFIFFMIGDIAVFYRYDSHLYRWLMGGGKTGCFIFSMFFIMLTIIIGKWNESILMYGNQYGNAFYFLLTSLMGTLGILSISKLINSNNFFEQIGCNTLPILLLHFYVLMTSHVLFHKIMPMVNNYLFPVYLLHFSIAAVACLFIAKVIKRWFPWLIKYPYL